MRLSGLISGFAGVKSLIPAQSKIHLRNLFIPEESSKDMVGAGPERGGELVGIIKPYNLATRLLIFKTYLILIIYLA